ncbi:unnamed protein product [Rotaria magnacalcarata]|uniref:Uncharacterized protein n=1 Tax=Rotaria magnacalcarata TaxID=392030 RepID=A0A816MFZ0_9BILA|nr:unnamed protein product [Rotaria magnacalcarata]CAF1996674.1 unnamed protein product [Rotaria magnacalcarata]CAF2124627.1 unnamed protein product [Rotaria magnacalcarata]CAF3826215.1 unnamed protein product [Rotaria magnacalcarata]CAF3894391.1 unnamed protein product [Rotaria magnacalcarata]
MAAVYELEDPSEKKDKRLKSLRLIELSDRIMRVNRRESTQLELRLNQLKQQEKILRRTYDREIYWRRMQLENIYDSLNDSPSQQENSIRSDTPISIHAIKMQRNQSASPSRTRTQIDNGPQSRPSTASTGIRRNKRALSALRDITLKPSCRTLGNLLILLDSDKKGLLR